MKLSKLLGNRLKEAPKDASLISHILLYRAGYIRQNAAGIYSYLPLAYKTMKKIIDIVREEMDKVDGQEVLLPSMNPREMWDKTGRYQSICSELIRFQDRNEKDYVLAMTHEEAVAFLGKSELFSYKQIPFMIYQFQLKFRDEPRSRGGLVRVREFTMKDAYSFHLDDKDLQEYYYKVHEAYSNIFSRTGLKNYISVQSDVGMMGGKLAHEFMLLCDDGEDTLIICPECEYKANKEIARCRLEEFREKPLPMEKVHTPGQKTIEQVAGFLDKKIEQTGKAVFYYDDTNEQLIFVLIRGDLEVNETKLKNRLKSKEIRFATDEEILKTGAYPGYASILNLKSSDGLKILIDESVLTSDNLVVGANEKDYHYINFNLKRDYPDAEIFDLYSVPENSVCPECGNKLKLSKGIEIGNIFQLGDKYTKSYEIQVLDQDGKPQTPMMCSYGIGIGRLLASVVEESHDENGIIWPMSIAPFQVHLLCLSKKEDAARKASDDLYKELLEQGIEVLYDERKESPGIKFADADLIGIPVQIIISDRNIETGEFEIRLRKSKDSRNLSYSSDYIKEIKNIISKELSLCRR